MGIAERAVIVALIAAVVLVIVVMGVRSYRPGGSGPPVRLSAFTRRARDRTNSVYEQNEPGRAAVRFGGTPRSHPLATTVLCFGTAFPQRTQPRGLADVTSVGHSHRHVWRSPSHGGLVQRTSAVTQRVSCAETNASRATKR